MSDFDADQALARIDRIQALLDRLARAREDIAEQQDIAERMRRELAVSRAALQALLKHKKPPTSR